MNPIPEHPQRTRHSRLPLVATGVLGLSLALLQAPSWAFDSGSTGVDGAFSPSVDTELTLPEDGVFNFTSINIPADVTVSFRKNTTNTPVVLLASGNVTIAGTIDVSGGDSTHVGSSGDGNPGDDGIPGRGGPGGYDGGPGGLAEDDYLGGAGLGPGGGGRGVIDARYSYRYNGAGGSYATAGESWGAAAGETYGSTLLLPLIGGSGGGGGTGGNVFGGAGGGGGGGAILIAASGTLDHTGSILAQGGTPGISTGANCGATGGGGSGGAVRLVATTLSGNGTIAAGGGGKGGVSCSTSGYTIFGGYNQNNRGGHGRIRLEAETMLRTAATSPSYTFGVPGEAFLAGLPTLRIASVAGVDAPAVPTGSADISLPADVVNPVEVVFEATGIPLGNVIELRMTPARGEVQTSISNALDGDSALSTASASISLPPGPSTLSASITYTLVASLAEQFEQYAGGEKVERMRLEIGLRGEPRYVLITESGREISIARAQLAAAG